MNESARYRLTKTERGEWNVIDMRTGGPVEVEVNGSYHILWKLPKEAAEAWLSVLTTTPSERPN